MSTSNPFDDFDSDAWEVPSQGSPFASSDSSAPAGHVPDRAGHSGRRVRARVADFIGGGDSYAGPKAEKPAKAPLRDRIADKIATKPRSEGAPAAGGSASESNTIPHTHDDWCGFDCDRKTDPAPAPAPAAEDKSKRTSPPKD